MASGGGKHVRRAWRQQLRWLRAHPIFLVGSIALGIGAAVPTLLMPYGQRMFVLGMVVVLVVACQWWFSLVSTNSYRLYVGGMAEDFTSETLRGLSRLGWRVVNNVEFADFDVDHVAVGPGGILAVETKWTDKPWDVDATVRDRWLDDAIIQARIGARRIKLFLRSAGVDVPVVPTLVLWGPLVVDIEDGSRLVDGTVVLVGRQERVWKPELRHVRIDQWAVDAASEALDAYQRAHADRVAAARSR